MHSALAEARRIGALKRPVYKERGPFGTLGYRAKEMLPEARKHRADRIVTRCPGLGPIRTAALLPIAVTPYRFANKRGFWSY